MRALSKILKTTFITLGIVFFILILGVGYIWVADPFNVRSLGISPASVLKAMTGNSDVEVDNIDKNPLLTEEQEAQLESLGVEPEDLPSEITPEMEQCFNEKLGEERTQEIIDGDEPTASDFFKARSCIDEM